MIEILPEAQSAVLTRLQSDFPSATVELRMGKGKDGVVMSDNGNLLADMKFTALPELAELNTYIKMMPGIVDHSLFFKMAHKAVIAGENGVRIITPQE